MIVLKCSHRIENNSTIVPRANDQNN